jgi:hypothetical protein
LTAIGKAKLAVVGAPKAVFVRETLPPPENVLTTPLFVTRRMTFAVWSATRKESSKGL